MVGFRNTVEGTSIGGWWSNGDQQISFCRGSKGFIAFTNAGDINQRMYTCLPEGSYCDVISGEVQNGRCTGKVVKVEKDGYGHISLLENEEDGVLAVHVNSRITLQQ